MITRQGVPPECKLRPVRHEYVLCGLLRCGSGMRGLRADETLYYRRSLPAGHAPGPGAPHPRNFTLRQDAVLGPLDRWLAGMRGPGNLATTTDELAAAAVLPQPSEAGKLAIWPLILGRKVPAQAQAGGARAGADLPVSREQIVAAA